MKVVPHLLSFYFLLELVRSKGSVKRPSSTTREPPKASRQLSTTPKSSTTSMEPSPSTSTTWTPSSSSPPLEFYKGVTHPWDSPEGPKIDVFNWEWYFNEVLGGGARNFLLTGCIRSEQVAARGGKMMLLGLYFHDNDFDKGTFQSSARKFLETYPVDGFLRKILIMKGLAEASKELGMIFMTKCDYFKWHRALETEVPQLVDLNVVVLKPNVHRNVSAEEGMFLTDANAEKVISDAHKAGVRKEKLTLAITPIARTVRVGPMTKSPKKKVVSLDTTKQLPSLVPPHWGTAQFSLLMVGSITSSPKVLDQNPDKLYC
ncbi:hypothetical protein FOZ62_009037 [Perkinsus olseni]|uniref:Uncharacterized protein n=1 Tax=Perkinsus olseni TaxID=32597 RepID=A0A7J6UDC8_PEROL|nr:hypothetical protein FOZ62_009037 [Perkinsus olseni]